MGAQKTFPHSRENLPLVYASPADSMWDRKYVWLRALRLGAFWNVACWSPKVTEASSVVCPAFNSSVSFQPFITHMFLSALRLYREDLQWPEPIPGLSLGPHQLRLRGVGPDLARELQRSLQGTKVSWPCTSVWQGGGGSGGSCGWVLWQLALTAGDFLTVKQYHIW